MCSLGQFCSEFFTQISEHFSAYFRFYCIDHSDLGIIGKIFSSCRTWVQIMPIWSKVVTLEVKQKPTLFMASYGKHRSRWAKIFQPFIYSQSELALEYLIPIRNLMNYAQVYNYLSRRMVASSLVCSTLDQVTQVRALARDIMLCSWTRHSSLTVPLSTQMYEWISATAN